MVIRTLGIVIVSLLLLTSLIPVTAGTADEHVAIEDVSYSGTAVIGTDNGTVMLWQSEPHVLNVTIASPNVSKIVEVCAVVEAEDNGTDRDATCQSSRLSNQTSKTFTLHFEEWPANDSLDEQTVAITVGNVFGNENMDRRTVMVHAIGKDADADGDGLTNEHETILGTDLSNPDSDSDGFRDGEEVKQYETDPTKADSDNDGLRDGDEISRGTDPNDADTDGDGLADGTEVSELGTNPARADTDGDGLADTTEIDEYETDPVKADTDGDGLGDSEEADDHGTNPTKADTDGDGLADAVEIDEYGTDPTTTDMDGDRLSDATEVAIGTDPNSAMTPLAYVLAGIVIVVGSIVTMGYRLGVFGGAAHVAANGGSEPMEDANPEPAAKPRLEPPLTAPNPTPSSTLVTDEDRVLQLLEQNSGRLQQSVIVEETDWSKSKVSRLLSKMETNDQINKITIGRENLITYPSDEPLGSGPEEPPSG